MLTVYPQGGIVHTCEYKNCMSVCFTLCVLTVYPQGGIVHTREYKNWRDSGEAFTVREGSYDAANKTLASGMVLRHVRLEM